MSAEPSSASLVSRFALPAIVPQAGQGYYRSKLVTTASTTNPLVAAAGPLLSLIERLCTSQTIPSVDMIRANIEHELNAFQNRLKSIRYTDEFSVIAHFLLCVTLDELLGKNYMRLYGKKASFQAFTPIAQDEKSPQTRFFDIIHYINERATQYIDLIELSYFCLIAGVEGEYHQRADGRLVLDNLIQTSHDIIQQHRVHKSIRLFKEPLQHTTDTPINQKPILKAVLLSFITLIVTYALSQGWIDHQAKILFTEHVQHLTLDI